MQQHLIDPETIPDDPFAAHTRPLVRRHQFTREECRRGGLAAASKPKFRQIQQKGIQRYIEIYGEESLHIVCRHAKRRRQKGGA